MVGWRFKHSLPLRAERQILNKYGGEGGIRTPGSLRYTRLAGGHHRPLGHLSATNFILFTFRLINLFKLAEEVGFEPTELSFNSFQDCRLKPLGHSSETI